MNLRISLVLIILVSWFSVFGVLVLKSDIGSEKSEDQINYFYRISSGDITNISIRNQDNALSWRLIDNTWYFDNMDGIPADTFRWGGIIDLLQGPQLYRTLSENIDDKSKYGLEDPSTEISIFLASGDKRTLFIGDATPDLQNNYAYLEGDNKLVMVDSTWKGVLARLVDEPPYPKWMYKLNEEDILEVIIINDNEIKKAYTLKSDGWYNCIIPLTGTPCNGNEKADSNSLISTLLLSHSSFLLSNQNEIVIPNTTAMNSIPPLAKIFFISKSTHHPTNKKPHECGAYNYIFFNQLLTKYISISPFPLTSILPL